VAKGESATVASVTFSAGRVSGAAGRARTTAQNLAKPRSATGSQQPLPPAEMEKLPAGEHAKLR